MDKKSKKPYKCYIFFIWIPKWMRIKNNLIVKTGWQRGHKSPRSSNLCVLQRWNTLHGMCATLNCRRERVFGGRRLELIEEKLEGQSLELGVNLKQVRKTCWKSSWAGDLCLCTFQCSELHPCLVRASEVHRSVSATALYLKVKQERKSIKLIKV